MLIPSELQIRRRPDYQQIHGQVPFVSVQLLQQLYGGTPLVSKHCLGTSAELWSQKERPANKASDVVVVETMNFAP